jgi:hypothetical protein
LGGRRRAQPTEGVGGGRCVETSDEVPLKAGQRASLLASIGPRQDTGTVARPEKGGARQLSVATAMAAWRRCATREQGGGLLNRRWGMGAPSSLRRAVCRPLHRSTASTLGRRALVGEAATDRRARQCTDGGEVEGYTWRARASRASECPLPRDGTASGRRERPKRRGGVRCARARQRAGARAASRPASFASDWHYLSDKNSNFCN